MGTTLSKNTIFALKFGTFMWKLLWADQRDPNSLVACGDAVMRWPGGRLLGRVSLMHQTGRWIASCTAYEPQMKASLGSQRCPHCPLVVCIVMMKQPEQKSRACTPSTWLPSSSRNQDVFGLERRLLVSIHSKDDEVRSRHKQNADDYRPMSQSWMSKG